MIFFSLSTVPARSNRQLPSGVKQRMPSLLSLFLSWGNSWWTNPNSLPPPSAQLGHLVPLLPLHRGRGRPSGRRRCEGVQKEVFLTPILGCQNLRTTGLRGSRAKKACPEQVLLFLKGRAKLSQICPLWGRREREGASWQKTELLYYLHERWDRRDSMGSWGERRDGSCSPGSPHGCSAAPGWQSKGCKAGTSPQRGGNCSLLKSVLYGWLAESHVATYEFCYVRY